MKKIKLIIIPLASLMFLSAGCYAEKMAEVQDKCAVSDIVYKPGNGGIDDLYIKENGQHAAYLPIKANDNGDVLLLRKYLLDISLPYNDTKFEGTSGSYYPGSKVDEYLNTHFFNTLDKNVRDLVADSDIEVATENSLQNGGRVMETEIITRKIFLLSATEIGIKSDNMVNKEGTMIDYFSITENKFASVKDGEDNSSHWTRSSYLWDDIQAWVVYSDAVVGGGAVSAEHRLRPAFYIKGDAEIEKSGDVTAGQSLYVMR